MGGFAGILHYRSAPPDRRVVAAMAERLRHRGPDGQGEFFEGPAAFAHRLRETVPTHSAQPVVTDDLVLLMDGWIFDPVDVVRSTGSHEEVRSDTQALLAAWRRWTFEFVDHLEGAFAAALWNRRNHTLTLFRDRLGTAPLFWARSGARFAFASELPALLQVPWVSRELAREHVAEYLSFRLVHAPRTLLRDVHQVEPAHWLRVNADGVQTRRYWSPSYAPPGTRRPSAGEVIPALQEAVRGSVRRRLAGGAATGLYLSGGLGSTAIAAAARKLGQTLPTFTVSFDDDAHPETPFAGRVASLLGMSHHEIRVGSGDLAHGFVDAVRAMGHPTGNPAIVVQLALARYVRQHVRVALSGDGGEELLGGRRLTELARRLQVAERFSRVPQPVRRRLARAAGRYRRLRPLVTPPERWGLVLGIGGTDQFSVDEREALLLDSALVRPEVRAEVLAPFYSHLETDPVNAVLHAFLRSWLGEGSLVRADRTGAWAGLDVRFPLLDRQVVELAASLPGSFKLRRGTSVHTRWPLQEMLSGILPPTLVNRPKRGMPTPMDAWLAGPGRLFLEEWCGKVHANEHRLWRVETLERMRRESLRRGRFGIRIWSFILLEAWLREVVGR